MKTDPERILTYFHQWSDPHHAVVECTTGWYWFCDLLHTAGIDIAPAHAKYQKAISYAKVKTDAVDAETLAQPLRMGLIPSVLIRLLPGRSLPKHLPSARNMS